MSTTARASIRPAAAAPAWDVARLFPNQGHWTDADYLALETNHLVELADGFIEVRPMPKMAHKRIVAFLYGLLLAFVQPRGQGTVLFAPFRVQLRPGTFREPDVLFMQTEHDDRTSEEFWNGADLVMEVVSDDAADRHRDLITKRSEYARAGIREYWIVDPAEKRVTVLKLSGKRYLVHGEFGPGQTARSELLRGFEVDVSALLLAGAKKRRAGK